MYISNPCFSVLKLCHLDLLQPLILQSNVIIQQLVLQPDHIPNYTLTALVLLAHLLFVMTGTSFTRMKQLYNWHNSLDLERSSFNKDKEDEHEPVRRTQMWSKNQKDLLCQASFTCSMAESVNHCFVRLMWNWSRTSPYKTHNFVCQCAAVMI